MNKKIESKFLDIAGTVMLALGIVFTGISMFSEKLEQKYNNLIGALLCVSLSHMFSVIKEYNDRQEQ